MQGSYVDLDRQCRDCGQTFLWTAGEQHFYAQRGLTNAPSRCPGCRAAVREDRLAGGNSAYARTQELFAVVCARCGVQTQVPFAPRHDRPVYCSTCYDLERKAGGVSG